MNKVKITKLHQVKKDKRGDNHSFSIKPTKDFLLVTRKKGTISGEHYHQGKSKQKDPETLIIVKGKFILECKNLKTGEKLKTTVVAPSKLEIGTNIWHKVIALTDITFLEANSLAQHKRDTIKLPQDQLS